MDEPTMPSTLSADLSSRAVLAAPCTRQVSVSVNLALAVYADVHIANYKQALPASHKDKNW